MGGLTKLLGKIDPLGPLSTNKRITGFFDIDKPEPLKVPEPLGPPPSLDDAIQSAEQRDMLLRRKGRAASVLTGPLGAGLPNTAAKSLTGE